MRITQSMLFRQQAESLTAAYGRLFDVQQQLSSGRRLLKPSDDPASIRPALDVRTGRRRLEQVKKNADLASSELGTAEGILRNALDIVSRGREIAVAGASGTLNQGDREAMAIEVDGLLKQLISLSNTRGLSGYLFAGGLKSSAPYAEIATADGPMVVYRGDQSTASVDLGDSLEVELNVPGSQIFGIGARGTTQYSGTTGATAGAGNDSARGTDRLTVTHSSTTLGDGLGAGGGDSVSGLGLGASSAEQDTLLGVAGNWSLTLVDTSGTGAAGTVSLNGGPPVSFTAADRDLAVAAADGTVVHLDLGAVAAGFNGTVGAVGDGTLSLDGGLTTMPIDFTASNQLVVDSETHGSIFVDARGIQTAGVDVLRFRGSYDLFSALIELRDSLKNVDGNADDVQLQRIRETLSSFDDGQNVLLANLSSLGARLRLAGTTRSRADELDLLLASNQASLEDVDFAEASIELSQAQLVLQAGVSVSSRLAQLPSLTQLL
ncbi:MAG: flagellar hook-associated protein 3 [Planctomycetes bacterium]|nr:flagellar hook-associated protein 3 [Planctomycetota bacterium]